MQETKRYPGWLIIFLGVMMMNFGYSCLVSVAGVFMNPVSTDLGIQIGDLAVYLTIQSVVSIVALLVISKFYSEKTIKPILVGAAICGIVGFIGLANAQNVTMFYLFAIPLGICFACMTTTPCTLLINNWYGPALRGQKLGYVFGLNSFCVMFIIPILNFIVQSYSWRTAYYVLAICLLVCIPLIVLFATWAPSMKGITERPGELAEDPDAASKLKGYEFKEGLKKPIVWLAFITGTLLVIASASVLTYAQPAMETAGLSPMFASNTVSIAIGLTLVTCVLVGKLVDKYGVRAGVILTGIFFIIAFIAQMFIPGVGLPMVIVFVIGYGIGCPAVNVVTPVMITKICGDKNAPAFIGYANMFIAIGGAISATVVGQIVNACGGDYTGAFVFLAVLLAIMTILRFVCASPKFQFQED